MSEEERTGLPLETDPENTARPKQDKGARRIGNPKKSILSDLILEKRRQSHCTEEACR